MNTKLKEILNSFNNQINENKREINFKNSFKLPICYLEEKFLIQENIKSDLELEKSQYNFIFNPKSEYEKNLIFLWNKYYTTNIEFLEDSKKLIKNFNPIKMGKEIDIQKVDNILTELNNETGFYEKYSYLDIKNFYFLNQNSSFLQGLTMYNLTSPILSLAIPIIMLIIPFFMIKFQHGSITLSQYFKVLIKVFQNHIIGKALEEFKDVGWDRRFFIIISIIFYFINIYQNIFSCYNFYKNIYKIKDYLINISNFISFSINSINNINKYCGKTYNKFINKNKEIINTLTEFNNNIINIGLEKINLRQIIKIGNILQCFYNLFNNFEYKEAIYYSLYLNGYIENIIQIQINISKKNMNYCKFITGNTSFTDAYFAPLVNRKPIYNSYKLKKNMIVTGPNASGKTTLLKTTLFNIILSQQIGVGFYKKAILNPYRYLHSYINIPDTSDRDSLFQAEARRCKEILDIVINSKKGERHFCIFDEIFSGTNPDDAIASAYSFLLYISNYRNIDFLLTTHYIYLCEILEKNKYIKNIQMEYKNKEYSYKIKNGISKFKGGIKVLEDLKFPEEILNVAKEKIF